MGFRSGWGTGFQKWEGVSEVGFRKQSGGFEKFWPTYLVEVGKGNFGSSQLF